MNFYRKALLSLREARDSSACMKAPSEEIYGKSTQGTYCWKVHSVGYNAVADSIGLSSCV